MCAGTELLVVYENFGQVVACDCGSIHVTVGPVSVALDGHALRRLHNLVGAAVEKLNFEKHPSSPASFPHSSHLALRKVMKIKH